MSATERTANAGERSYWAKAVYERASISSGYRWRREYGGLKVDQARRLKDLEKENARLRKAVSDLTLDKQILKEAAEGNF